MDYALYLFGALALITNFIGYRQNTINHYRFVSAFALAFLGTHFFMLGALAAALTLWLGAIRNIVAMRYRQPWIVYLFVFLNLIFCLLEWFVLNNSPLLFIAYASALIFTVGSIVLTTAASIRRWFVLAESLGLIYAIAVGSVFGVLFNISNLTSIFIKMRSDRRSKLVQS